MGAPTTQWGVLHLHKLVHNGWVVDRNIWVQAVWVRSHTELAMSVRYLWWQYCMEWFCFNDHSFLTGTVQYSRNTLKWHTISYFIETTLLLSYSRSRACPSLYKHRIFQKDLITSSEDEESAPGGLYSVLVARPLLYYCSSHRSCPDLPHSVVIAYHDW